VVYRRPQAREKQKFNREDARLLLRLMRERA
jgi:hypothetical protein